MSPAFRNMSLAVAIRAVFLPARFCTERAALRKAPPPCDDCLSGRLLSS